MSEPGPEKIVILFTEWLARENILPRITEQECADLSRAFFTGFLLGRDDALATPASPSSWRRVTDRPA
jgi:hypothetical protein